MENASFGGRCSGIRIDCSTGVSTVLLNVCAPKKKRKIDGTRWNGSTLGQNEARLTFDDSAVIWKRVKCLKRQAFVSRFDIDVAHGPKSNSAASVKRMQHAFALAIFYQLLLESPENFGFDSVELKIDFVATTAVAIKRVFFFASQFMRHQSTFFGQRMIRRDSNLGQR